MAIPNTRVNIQEVNLAGRNVLIPFIPAVLLKTKSGPIGTVERITTEAQFIAMFGQSDTTTPAAYTLQKYLRAYQYAYVTRISSDTEAKFGTAEISFKKDENDVKLISATTNYKTDLENGKAIKLVYDANSKKIYIDLSDVFGKNVTTIKEDIDVTTLKAAEHDEDGTLTGGLEFILNKLVNSANAITGITLTLTNEFTNKTDSDSVPTVDEFTAGFTKYIEKGDSGNKATLNNTDIMAFIDLYNYQDYPIDEMVIPEYRAAEVVNYAVTKGRENYYRVIANATGKTVSDIQTSVQNYVADERGTLEVYAPDVYFADYVDENGNPIECPVSVAVLNAYGQANRQNAWSSIAGVNRGTLSNVTGLTVKFTKEQGDLLYDGQIPVNIINYISSVGYIVWGNKTTVTEDVSKFFDRVNVSRLVNYLNRELTQVSWKYLFEPITLSLFANFTAELEGVCDNVKAADGIEDYIVICNSSNNTAETIARNEMHAEVQVKPVESLEYIIINLTVTDTIVSDVTEGGAK